MLLGEMSDAQGLGKPGGPRRVELQKSDTALDDEVPYRKPGQFALAVRERDWRCCCQPSKVGRLQVPMQWLLEV